jgi:hypothetical protein
MKNKIITILMILFSINLAFALENTGNDGDFSSTDNYDSKPDGDSRGTTPKEYKQDEYKANISTKNNNDNQVYCKDVYAPVCVEIQVQCIKAPCPVIKETYSNSCEAERNKLGEILYKGKCEEENNKNHTPYVENMGIKTGDNYVSIKTQTNVGLIFNYHDLNDKSGYSGRFTTGSSITELGNKFKYKVENGHEYSYSFQEVLTDKYLWEGRFSLPEIANKNNINETNSRPIYQDQSDKFDIKYLFNEKTGQYTFYISLNETSLRKGQFKLDKQEYKSENNLKQEENKKPEPSKSFWNKLKFWS